MKQAHACHKTTGSSYFWTPMILGRLVITMSTRLYRIKNPFDHGTFSKDAKHMSLIPKKTTTQSHIPAPSSRGAKWFRYRVSIHHPLGFIWHPFEGAGINNWVGRVGSLSFVYIGKNVYIYLVGG